MDNLAPIVIFAYNRPNHLLKLLTSLQKNEIIDKTDVFFYIDKAKDSTTVSKNNEVIEIVNRQWNFRNKSIVIRENNYGLKKNILNGVSEVINKYGNVIVLEDDLIVSKNYLEFMNKALDKYKDTEDVWHITGFNYKTPYLSKKESYFTTHMNCWGWATWKNNWNQINNNLSNKIEESAVQEFNFGNLIQNNYQQILLNEENLISTWAIFWYQTIFLNRGLCLMPAKTLVYNAGFDGSGINTSKQDYKLSNLNNSKVTRFPNKVSETFIYKKFLKYYFWRLNLNDFFKYHLKKLVN